MKTIAVLTDFSPASEHAAQYAMHLAQKIRASVALYAANPIISRAPAMTTAGWPDYMEEEMPADNPNPLDVLAERLCNHIQGRSFPDAFLPLIESCPDENFITNSFLGLEEDKDTVLLVLAANACSEHDGAISTYHWRKAINAATIPVLVVPENAAIRNVEKFVFATDT